MVETKGSGHPTLASDKGSTRWFLCVPLQHAIHT